MITTPRAPPVQVTAEIRHPRDCSSQWSCAFPKHSLVSTLGFRNTNYSILSAQPASAGSFNLCHSDTNKLTLAAPPLLSALQDLVSSTRCKVLKWHFSHTWQVPYRTHHSLRLLGKSDRPTSLQHRDKLRQQRGSETAGGFVNFLLTEDCMLPLSLLCPSHSYTAFSITVQ